MNRYDHQCIWDLDSNWHIYLGLQWLSKLITKKSGYFMKSFTKSTSNLHGN